MRPGGITRNLCPPKADERPNGRRAAWREAKQPDGRAGA
jgi:hypothetical protein